MKNKNLHAEEKFLETTEFNGYDENSQENGSFDLSDSPSLSVIEADDGYEYRDVQVEKTEKASRTPDEQLRLLYAYFKDIANETLLTREQEVEISAKIKMYEAKGVEIGNILSKSVPGFNGASSSNETPAPIAKDRFALTYITAMNLCDVEARKLKQKFARANLRLVVSMAKRYMNEGLPMSDLIQEGNVGLLKAVDRFDHTKGYKFSTYASWWIRQAISRALLDQTRTIKVPIYLFEQASRVYRANSELKKQLGRKPTIEEVSESSGLTAPVVKRILTMTDDATSLDIPIQNGEKATFLDFVADEFSPMADSLMANDQLAGQLRTGLEILTDREREIVILRYGIDLERRYTLDEIGKMFNLTRERIRQIEKGALEKMAASDLGDVLRSFLEQE